MATDDAPADGDGTRRDGDEGGPTDALAEGELEALHEVELGLEWLQRAQGSLIEFHHATGHGMDHLRRAESILRATGHADLANVIRDDLLPCGVVDGDRWSYDVLESYQETLLTEAGALERRARRELSDGQRHVRERLQEREWKGRSRRG
ncbi:hypothetical protein ACFQGT_19055 [Natrialbaceae archaeon GCM10025810]|uniref:hypothetical protein n=1 Tax=Halovalidus salilacus TaxID=3075124 RepID=UPI00361F5ED5